MFLKWILWLLIGVWMTACGASSTATPVRPEGQELVLWHSFEGEQRDALLAQVDEFNATNPWRIVVVPEFHGGMQQLGAECKLQLKQARRPMWSSAIRLTCGRCAMPSCRFKPMWMTSALD